MRALIVEDETHCAEHLTALLEAHIDKVEIVGISSSIEQAEQDIARLSPDLLFLDVNLGAKTSFELLDRLEHLTAQVIFTTAYQQYALQAFQVNALHFLLKPISAKELSAAIDRALTLPIPSQQLLMAQKSVERSLDGNDRIPKQIRVNNSQGFKVIVTSDIVHLDANGYTTHIYTLQEKARHTPTNNMKTYEYLTNDHRFFKVHRSHIINFSHISHFDGKNVYMNNDSKIPVSERKKPLFKKAYDQFLSESKLP